MWDHDEAIFSEKMKQWGVVTNQYFPIVMNNGLGDHLAFKTLMPEILNKYGNQKILLAVCYPDLYREYAMTNQNVRILSIADAQMSYGEGINQFDIYKWMVEHHWAGHMLGAFRALYNLETKTV
jgi:hypothetical protein